MIKPKTFLIISTISIIALGIILFPAALNTDNLPQHITIKGKIPPQPLLPTLESLQVSPTTPTTPPDAAKEVPTPAAYSVELTTFPSKDEATNLVSTLQAKDFTAYSRVNSTENGIVYQVLVGPELKRARAEALAASLEQVTEFKGKIVDYKVD